MRLQQPHGLIVDLLVRILVHNGRARVAVVNVLVHDPLLLSQPPDHVTMLQCGVAESNESLFGHRSPVGRLLLSRREALQLSPLLCLHALHLQPVDLVEPGQVLSHGPLLLPLVAQHLVHKIHLHGAPATAALISHGLLDFELLPRVRVAVRLGCIEALLVYPELANFRCVPQLNEAPGRQLEWVILLEDFLCHRKGRDLSHLRRELSVPKPTTTARLWNTTNISSRVHNTWVFVCLIGRYYFFQSPTTGFMRALASRSSSLFVR
ncbi:MAG TPA: hypothetical protein VLA31_06325 [Burkholderiaceae bacterium]|nr:hypothetical protein [Burkholderiaceae bacterium]